MVRPELILIGYWRREAGNGWSFDDRWPAPANFVDRSWDVDERDAVSDYLRRGFVVRAYMGYSPCRLCDRETNGNLELSDGVYVWPEGLSHYVLDHGVRLPEPFVAHVMARIEDFETAGRDESWWRAFVS